MKRDATFATIVNTGEQPDAEIHMAGFDEESGLHVIAQNHGGGRTLAMLATSLIESMVKSLQEKDSAVAAASFIMIVNEAMHKASNVETAKCTAKFMMCDLDKFLSECKGEATE